MKLKLKSPDEVRVVRALESNVKTEQEMSVMDKNITAVEVVTPESIPMVAYAGTPVITTALLAKLYGTDDVRIRQNFDRNEERFVAGKHYYKLEGVELKSFKDSVSQSYSVDVVQKRARTVILWTERGAARHAKMLDTNAAWDAFEKLEDCYFDKVEKAQASSAVKTKPKALPNGLTTEQQEAIKGLVKARVDLLPQDKRAKAAVKCWSALKNTFGCTYKKIDPNQFTDAVSLVARLELEGEFLGKEPTINPTLNELDLAMLYVFCIDTLELIHVGEEVKPIFDVLRPVKLINVPTCLSECREVVAHLHERFGPQMEQAARNRGAFDGRRNLAAAGDPSQPIWIPRRAQGIRG